MKKWFVIFKSPQLESMHGSTEELGCSQSLPMCVAYGGAPRKGKLLWPHVTENAIITSTCCAFSSHTIERACISAEIAMYAVYVGGGLFPVIKGILRP